MGCSPLKILGIKQSMNNINEPGQVLKFKKEGKLKEHEELEAQLIQLANKTSSGQTSEQEMTYSKMTAQSILETLRKKDEYTFEHSTRVAYFASLIAAELGFSKKKILELEFAALFHDIGKIGIPDSILKKEGRLTEEEFEEMKKHPVHSADIIKHFLPFKPLVKAVRHHHERFDGTGYPHGLKKEEIPLFSRMILVADTFDAMTSTRPYRKGLPQATAYEELMRASGSQFDPEIVKAFIRAMRKENQKEGDFFYLQVLNQEYLKEAA